MFENCAHYGQVKQQIRSATDEEEPVDELRASDVPKDEAKSLSRRATIVALAPILATNLLR
jgi:hypothetical protein